MELVYLDLCCYKRPFDDPAVERVRREAAAVASILDWSKQGRLGIVRSPALALENGRNPREDRRLAATLWLDGAAVDVPLTQEVCERARHLVKLGIFPIDALHVAFAEAAGARYLVTCDDQLLAAAGRHRKEVRIEVLRPDELLVRSEP